MNTPMTSEARDTFVQMVDEQCGQLTCHEVLGWLAEHNLLSPSRCHAYIARKMVDEQLRRGLNKVNAMSLAAERLGCSYECVRKYVYYKYR